MYGFMGKLNLSDNLGKNLQEYAKKYYPLHMPGHKGGRIRIIEDLYEVDVTETKLTDDLYYPTGILKNSLEKLKRFYRTQSTYFLTGGSTVGILSAISFHQKTDKILICKNSHKSVYNALRLLSLQYETFPLTKNEFGIVIGLDLKLLESTLKAQDITSFVITSPTYEGVVFDIKAIKRLCERYDVNLIVDGAHGAHITFFSGENEAITYSDILVESYHKTLPTLTGAGLLHINKKELVEPVLGGLKVFQTSSPSYVMMAQIDAVVDKFGGGEELIDDFLLTMRNLRKRLSSLDNITLLSNLHLSDNANEIDQVKVTLICPTKGYELEELLFLEGFIIEMAMRDYIVAIFTIADRKEIFDKFESSVIKIDKIVKNYKAERKRFGRSYGHELALPIMECEGKISSCDIIPYPPGVPMVLKGDVLNSETLEKLNILYREGHKIYGITQGKIVVNKEEI